MQLESTEITAEMSSFKASFEKLGSSLHLKIDDHHGLQGVLELDEALWIATTAPVTTLKVDPIFHGLLDSDGDGRIRAEEIKDGIRYLLKHLADHSGIRDGNLSLSLDAINRQTALGESIYISSLKVLKRLDVAQATVTLEQVRTVKQEVLEGGLDQAGIVLPEAVDNENILQYIKDILCTIGGKQHPNGKEGVDEDGLINFSEDCRHYLDWQLEAGELGSDAVTEIRPLGQYTAKAHALFRSLVKKFTQYFLLCNIKKLNPELLSRALETPEENVALNILDIEGAESYLQGAPLSFLNSEGTLELTGDMNPYFREKINELTEKVIKPLLGEDVQSIGQQSVRDLEQIFEPFVAWSARKPEVRIESVEAATIQRYLTDSSYRKTMEELISKSYETAFVLDNLRELERLLLYQAYMLPLVNSFVSFPKLYDSEQRALFEEGTLVMDGRHFTLAVKVEDRAHHIETSKHSNIFVIYCELYGLDGGKSCEVAVPVTSGNRGNIHLNKWGIFNDINGNELHAKVVDIVENPISVTEAMIEPFKRLNHSFFSRLENFSSKAEERLFHKGEKAKEKKKKDEPSAALFGGGGVAVAALGSSFAFITKTLAGLTFKTVIVSLLAVGALLTIPVGIATYYRLSRRDLSTFLEGSGWGINSRMKLTADQAVCFTCRPDSAECKRSQ